MITTFFWVGLLPSWQKQWVMVLSVPLFMLIVYTYNGNSFINLSLVDAGLCGLTMIPIIIISGIISSYLYDNNNKDSSPENFTISYAFMMILVITLILPGLLHVIAYIYHLYYYFINVTLHLSNSYKWIIDTTIIALLMIFLPMYNNYIVNFSIWPNYIFERNSLNYYNAFIVQFNNALYSTIIFYVLLIIFSDYDITKIIVYYQNIFGLAMEKLELISLYAYQRASLL
ncbi:MAG: hypothetical protein OEY79_01515 [Anaplasmataceae bacterium]|nr:hypothetical protein [Anaplasmataceae bacterium]